MTRVDLFTTIHKGLRAALFAAAQRVARADFARAADAAAVADAIGRLAELLDDHARHETREVLPDLARVAPELAADLAADHARLRGQEQQLRRLGARLDGAADAERCSLGRRLHDRFGPLIADHLRLMEREEVAAQRVLWAHRSDAELAAIGRNFVASLSPARLAAWLEVVAPAVSERERQALLVDLLVRSDRAARAETLPW
jgi:hypothetical protein